MSFSVAARHVRRLSTASTAAAASPAAAPTNSTISISKAKYKLKAEFDPDKALDIYSSAFKRAPFSASHYTQQLIIRRLAKAGRFDDVESLIESHKSNPKITEEKFLSNLIRYYGRAGMFEHALRMYNQMDDLGTPRSAFSFNALLLACNDSKLFDKAPQLFDEMPKKHNFSPNKFSYGILVKSYCELGSTEKALQVVTEMEEKGVEVTAVILTTILDSLYKKGEREEAEKVWNMMISKGCHIDVGAYNVRLMHLHGDGGKPEDVQAVIKEMANLGLKPDTISYNYLMVSYLKNGMFDEALNVYEELRGKGCKKNPATFRKLIYYLCINGRFGQGYMVFKESVKRHKIPDFDTLKLLAEGLVEKKMMTKAKGLARTLRKKLPPQSLSSWRELEESLGLGSVAADGTEAEAETEA